MNQYSILLLAASAVAWAQSTTTIYQRDINGRQVVLSTSSVAADGAQSKELVQTVNGRSVPREQISERVVRSDAKGKVTERTTKTLDPSGRESGSERVVIEESVGAGGVKIVKETTYRGTVNGPMEEQQRSTSETRVQGDVTTTDVTVERPAVNRSFSTAERRNIVTKGKPDNQQTTETVLRPDQSGRFITQQRRETTVTTQGPETKSTTALYDTRGASEPSLTSQKVTTTTKKADGTETTETNLYVPAMAGRVQHSGARIELQEQQLTEKRVAADGTVTETLSSRIPISTDVGRLGPARVVSETVCRGKCVAPPPPAEPKPTAPAPAKSASK